MSRRRSRSTRRPRRAGEARPGVLAVSGLVMFGIGGIVGNFAADVVHRIASGKDPTTYTSANAPTAQAGAVVKVGSASDYNNYAGAAHPGMMSIGLQVVLTVLGVIGGVAFRAPVLKALSWGFGFGAFFHLSTQIITAYIMEPLFSGSTTWGPRMYQHEWYANGAFGSGTMSGPPQQQQPGQMGGGAPAAQLPPRPAAMPSALASMARAAVPGAMGQLQPQPGGGGLQPSPYPPGPLPTFPPPGRPMPKGNCCEKCKAECGDGTHCDKCKPHIDPIARGGCKPSCDVVTDGIPGMGQPPPADPAAPVDRTQPAAVVVTDSILTTALASPLMRARSNLSRLPYPRAA